MFSVATIRPVLFFGGLALFLLGCSSIRMSAADERVEVLRRITNEVGNLDKEHLERMLDIKIATTSGVGRILHPPGRRPYAPAFGDDSEVYISVFSLDAETRVRARIQIEINAAVPNCLSQRHVVAAFGQPTQVYNIPAFISPSTPLSLHYIGIFDRASQLTFSVNEAGCVEKVKISF